MSTIKNTNPALHEQNVKAFQANHRCKCRERKNKGSLTFEESEFYLMKN